KNTGARILEVPENEETQVVGRRPLGRDGGEPPELLSLAPEPLEGWEIEVTGLITPQRIVIRAEELLEMDPVDCDMVLQGPGREGARNVRFTGVRLSQLLDRYGVKVAAHARFVTAVGREIPGEPDRPDFEHSLPIGDVLLRSMVALELNGKPLARVHGGPVRLVT